MAGTLGQDSTTAIQVARLAWDNGMIFGMPIVRRGTVWMFTRQYEKCKTEDSPPPQGRDWDEVVGSLCRRFLLPWTAADFWPLTNEMLS